MRQEVEWQIYASISNYLYFLNQHIILANMVPMPIIVMWCTTSLVAIILCENFVSSRVLS